MKSNYLTVKQVADLLLISAGTVRNWCEKGDLPVQLTPGGHRRFLLDDVLRFARFHDIPVAAKSSAEPRILIVDDDVAVSEYIRELLGFAQDPLELDCARDGFQAGDKLHIFKPDIVLLDLKMPGMDGYEVCKHIQAKAEIDRPRVIAMTAFPSESNVQRIIEAGAEQCLAKPLDVDNLFHALGLDVPNLEQEANE